MNNFIHKIQISILLLILIIGPQSPSNADDIRDSPENISFPPFFSLIVKITDTAKFFLKTSVSKRAYFHFFTFVGYHDNKTIEVLQIKSADLFYAYGVGTTSNNHY